MKNLLQIGYKMSFLLVLVMIFTLTGKASYAHENSMPNDQSTLLSSEKSLAGSYTIGGENADFSSLDQALT